mmetsp:Transcript_27870/g.83747  ORF Transcript_27870/g.83747 Transcript_27870/m.83747 type:complete len:241 (+) Transcript_27870:836-1558(+)
MKDQVHAFKNRLTGVSKRSQAVRKKIPQRSQKSSVNLSSLNERQLRQIASSHQAKLIAMLKSTQIDDEESRDEGPGQLFVLNVDNCSMMDDYDNVSGRGLGIDTLSCEMGDPYSNISMDATFTPSTGLLKNKLTITMSTDDGEGTYKAYPVLDTGSDVSAISDEMFKLLQKEGVTSGYVRLQDRKATAVNGSVVTCMASCCVELHIAKKLEGKDASSNCPRLGAAVPHRQTTDATVGSHN